MEFKLTSLSRHCWLFNLDTLVYFPFYLFYSISSYCYCYLVIAVVSELSELWFNRNRKFKKAIKLKLSLYCRSVRKSTCAVLSNVDHIGWNLEWFLVFALWQRRNDECHRIFQWNHDSFYSSATRSHLGPNKLHLSEISFSHQLETSDQRYHPLPHFSEFFPLDSSGDRHVGDALIPHVRFLSNMYFVDFHHEWHFCSIWNSSN